MLDMHSHRPSESPGEGWASVAHGGYPLINKSAFPALCPLSSLELPPVMVGYMCQPDWAKGCPDSW